jgi:phosphoglycolate phosphatase-like HAD superfamily hydrolase
MNILFDLDGTLGNTLPLCIAAFREAIEPLANRTLSEEEIIATFGPTEEGTIHALIPEHYEEGVERYLKSYKRLHSSYPGMFEGIPAILKFIKQQQCYVGLVTGKGPKSTQLTLESYALLDYFDCVKTGSIVGPVKRERIEEVIKETKLPRENFVYIGDAPSDIIVSRACGINVIAAAWAPTADFNLLAQHKPDYIFASVSDFSKMLMDQFET